MTASQQQGGAPSRQVGFRPVAGPHTGSSHLSEFDPPQDAEPTPTVAPPAEDSSSQSTPTVLSKLQKWGDYASVGEPVQPTKFIPMKTPMSREIISNWTLGTGPKHSLTVPELLEWQAARGRQVGMIIDLANHECLYEEDIPEWVEYEHVQLVAKVLPPPEAINDVARIANDFWRRQPEKFIAIHCAYGFNRTGFVVCAYLIQCCGLSVEQAMENFAEARPPGVKHEKFIHELYLRYGSREDSGHRGSGSASASASAADGSGAGADAQQERQQRQPGEEGPAGPEAQLPHAAALPPGRPLSRVSSRHGRSSRGSLSGASEQGGVGAGSEAVDGCGAPTDASCYVRRVSSRGGMSRGSSCGGLSMAVEEAEFEQAEARQAGAAAAASSAAAATAGEEREEGDEQPSDLQPASNLSAEADHLQSRMAVGRVTSLGLAKALCEDFSMFEGTPVRPSPLQSAMARESAFALAAANTPLDSPISPAAAQYWGSDCATPTAQRDRDSERAGGSCSSRGVCSRDSPGDVGGDDSPATAQQQQQQLERGCPGACTAAPGNGPFMAAAAAGGLSRSSSPILGPGGSACGGHGQAAAVCGRLPPTSRASAPGYSSSGGTPSPHAHPLPPLPYLTPVTSGVGCPSNRPPISPTSSNAVMDSGGHLGLGRTSQQQQQRGGGRFLRSMSVESENQSLGFGARQAIMHLRGEGGSPPPGQQRPLSLMELFNADGSRAGDTGDECDLDYSDYEGSWEDKPSRGGSRAGSYADLGAANPQLAGARGPTGPAAGQHAQHPAAQQQPKQRLPSQQEGRNGTSRCRVM